MAPDRRLPHRWRLDCRGDRRRERSGGGGPALCLSTSESSYKQKRVLREVEVGRLRIAYQRVGEGPAVLFLHGFFGDHRVWRQQLELAREYTLVAWDAPGCGRSAIPPENFR